MNEPRREAVQHPGGPLLILAGARVWQDPGGDPPHRVAARHPPRKPHQVLAITATNKAAEEMGARAIALTGHSGRG
jgi:DNA helicase-2/ATP-dependent DNA helicase PcrA